MTHEWIILKSVISDPLDIDGDPQFPSISREKGLVANVILKLVL